MVYNYYIMNITLQQMLALDAVVKQKSIQAGARYLNKTHPSVITALKKMEDELGFALFDRGGYRSVLSEKGKAFYKNVELILSDIQALESRARHIQQGEESELNIIIGDITPVADVLKILRAFSEKNSFTHLNLHFENLYGPNEQLLNKNADLIIHHIDKSDSRYEYQDYCQVSIVPVVAPGFLKLPINKKLKYSDLRDYTQCIIRDTAKDSHNNYFVDKHSPHLTVGDQHTKKEVILQCMGWGHMPLFLVNDEIENGELICISGDYIKGNLVDIVAARLQSTHIGIMAERLWQYFQQ